jgi:hypothetical protein
MGFVTHSEVKCDFGVPLLDKLVEASFLVRLESVGEGGCGDGGHQVCQKTDKQSCKSHFEELTAELDVVLAGLVGARLELGQVLASCCCVVWPVCIRLRGPRGSS